ncbi:MAG: membrane protein insertase YidC [Rhizobiaceae bacterium]
MENNRNFFVTIALSIVILTAWQVLYMNPRIEAQREAARIEAEREAEKQPDKPAPDKPADISIPQPGGENDNVPGDGNGGAGEITVARIEIDTPRVKGSINPVGARIDDLVLKDYHETVDKNSPNITLLEPVRDGDGYFAEIGYSGSGDRTLYPWADTVWTVEGNAKLTPTTPVTLSFDNGSGLKFTRTFAIDRDFLFTISDSIANTSAGPVSLAGYGRITRLKKPKIAGFYILHEGLIGVTGEEGLQEVDYDDLVKNKEVKPGKSTDGWLGFTDKYWAVAMVPPESRPFQPRYSYLDDKGGRYQSDYLTDEFVLQPGGTETLKTMVFAGAKQVGVIDRYETEHNIRQFELMIDWGWFHFITKPLFYLIDWLYKFLGNFGLAILATTVIVKLLFFPLANKSYASMANMKKVQPQMVEIREKYADDKMKQQQAMMELYKKEKINPIAGCWPMLLQIPVFFALYKVLFITIEMRHAPFYGWIKDLASPDPSSVWNLFGLLPWDPHLYLPAVMILGFWPLLMGVTMFLQMRMNPTPPDPTQAMMFTWMPVIFTFMLSTFPAGLVIYWAWNNTLSIIQQAVIMKRQGAKIELWDNLKGMFSKKPKQPAE